MISAALKSNRHTNGRPRSGSLTGACMGVAAAGVFIMLMIPAAALCDISSEWGGHVRAIGSVSWFDDQSIYQLPVNDLDSPFYDGQAELRLNNQLFLGPHWTLETHYEAVFLGGNTREANRQLRFYLSSGAGNLVLGDTDVNDDRRLLDLTHTIEDSSEHLFYHRLDRLNMTWAAALGTLRLGRQALTWGNGLVFNPMDLFNPFAPASVQRDYKTGEDMAHLHTPLGDGNAQLLFVPRRDPDIGDLREDQASYAGKYHLALTAVEFDLMAARHYGEAVVGAGITGYLGGAAWRLDTLYTRLNQSENHEDFWQVVANIDYAWQWGGNNIYGLLEYYHNSLGRNDHYGQAINDPAITSRLQRGELFTLGRHYLAGRLQVDLHPLVNTGAATIINLADGSGLFQPQLVWDVSTDWQLIFGANLYWGGDNTEFGGYETTVGFSTTESAPMDSAYLWLTFYY